MTGDLSAFHNMALCKGDWTSGHPIQNVQTVHFASEFVSCDVLWSPVSHCFWDWQILCSTVLSCVNQSPWASFRHVLFSSKSISQWACPSQLFSVVFCTAPWNQKPCKGGYHDILGCYFRLDAFSTHSHALWTSSPFFFTPSMIQEWVVLSQ